MATLLRFIMIRTADLSGLRSKVAETSAPSLIWLNVLFLSSMI